MVVDKTNEWFDMLFPMNINYELAQFVYYIDIPSITSKGIICTVRILKNPNDIAFFYWNYPYIML